MFTEILPEELNESAIRLIGHDYMLITAGDLKSCNTMTAAWGGLGFLWRKPVSFIFIRPNRFTYGFTEKHDYYSLCFFEPEHREILEFCGTCSGRDTDKITETGLKAVDYQRKTVYFDQASIVLICRKLYHQDIDPARFLDENIDSLYPLKDYHRMYIGEIEKALIRPK